MSCLEKARPHSKRYSWTDALRMNQSCPENVGEAHTSWSWREFAVPKESKIILLRIGSLADNLASHDPHARNLGTSDASVKN
jgi:hypothetical protein